MENIAIAIGTELVMINHYIYSNVVEYTFSKIARLTKTQAILENGVKVRLEKSAATYLVTVGSKYSEAARWYFATDEIREAAKNEHKRRVTEKNFKSKVFTLAEKAWILENLPANLK